jgi:hypothetical protein
VGSEKVSLLCLQETKLNVVNDALILKMLGLDLVTLLYLRVTAMVGSLSLDVKYMARFLPFSWSLSCNRQGHPHFRTILLLVSYLNLRTTNQCCEGRLP